MELEIREHQADLVIVGAGIPGICAAVQAARKGLTVALINDRGVLGGNASSEIHVNINGACDLAPLNINSREGGIVSEILTEYQYRSPVSKNCYQLDGVLLDIVGREPAIKLFLNTCIDEAVTDGSSIVSVCGSQNTSEIRWKFSGSWFVDDTGDGTLGALAGAEFMLGREAKETFGEEIAPVQADQYVLPSTLMFRAKDMGYKVPYKAPDFACDISASGALEHRVIPEDNFHRSMWYYEIGGEYDHVKDHEQIIADHRSLVYGIWDYIKNSGKYPQAENYDFEHISTIPGTREYRRLVGDYVLVEKDIAGQTDHDDTIGHGGWNIDLHAIKGFFDEDIVNRHIYFDGIYKVPYRTAYSKNIGNLFMCGRCMSVSHVALGSIRVIASLATVGQAVGMAAFLCKAYATTPRGIYPDHIRELQQLLLKDDQLVVGFKNEDENDLARSASVTASSASALVLPEQMNVDGKSYVESLVPDYRSRLRASYEEFTDRIGLGKALGISIPVVEKLDSVHIKVKADKATALKYNVYTPRKPENYGPDEKLSEGTVQLAARGDFEWIELPVRVTCARRYVLIELLENEDVEVAIGGRPLPTTATFRSRINTRPTVWDIKTMGMSHRVWERSPYSPCYRTEPAQPVYGGENVTNGYNRAYGAPNMWLSDVGDKCPSLTLSWDSPQDIGSLQVTFAVDTTKPPYWQTFDAVDPLVSRNYRVYAVIGGNKQLLTEVTGNFRKVNRWSFRRTTMDALVLEFETGSCGQVGVQEVRVYQEN